MNWNQLDDYGLSHLAAHLAELCDDEVYRHRLYELICPSFMWEKYARTYSHRAFADDVEQAIHIAGNSTPPDFVYVIPYCLLYATLGELTTTIPPKALAALTQLGHVSRALDYTDLILDPSKRNEAYYLMSEVLREQGRTEESRTLMNRALTWAKSEGDKFSRSGAFIRIASLLLKHGEIDQALTLTKNVTFMPLRIFAFTPIAHALIRADDLEQALMVAELIETDTDRVFVLSGIAQRFFQTDDKERATTVLNQVLNFSLAIKDRKVKTLALSQVAQTSAEIGDKTHALRIINDALTISEPIEDEYEKGYALTRVMQALFVMKEHTYAEKIFTQVLTIAKNIKETYQHELMLKNLAEALIEINEFPRVFLLLEEIHDPKEYIAVRCKLAQALAQTGDRVTMKQMLEQALALAEKLTDDQERTRDVTNAPENAFSSAFSAVVADMENQSSLLQKIARTCLDVDEIELALSVTEQIEDEKKQRDSLADVAQAFAKTGQKTRARELIERLTVTSETVSAPQSDEIQAFIQIAHVFVQREDTHKAKNLIDDILSIVKNLEEKKSRDFFLSKLIDVFAELGEFENALEIVDMLGDDRKNQYSLKELVTALSRKGLFRKALQVVKQVSDESDKAPLLNNIAETLYEAEKLDDALSVANMIHDNSHKATILANIAKAKVKAGDERQAVRLFEDALASAKLIEKERERATTLSRIAQAHFQAWNHHGSSIEILHQALHVAEESEDAEDRAFALKEVAQVFTEIGNLSQALALFENALTIAEHVRGKENKRFLLSMLAETFCQIGERNKAAKIAEQALTMTESDNDKRSDSFSEPEDGMMRSFRDRFALKRSAQVLVQAGDEAGLEHTLQTIHAIESDRETSYILAGAAEALIQRDDQRGLKHALSLINTIPDKSSKVTALRWLSNDLLREKHIEQAYQALFTAFMTARLDGRDSVLMTLQDGAKILVTLNQGQTLWRVYKAVRELEEWWRA